MKAVCGVCRQERIFCGECEPEAEREAADLWRRENPDMSVFACTPEMKRTYRLRVLAQRTTK